MTSTHRYLRPTLTLALAGALSASLGLAACSSDLPEEPAEAEAEATDDQEVAQEEPEAPPATEEELEPAGAIDEPEADEADPVDDYIANAGSDADDEMTFDPEPIDEPEETPEVPAEPADLVVREVFIATSVEDRMPVRPAVNFTTAEDELWGWVKVENHDHPSTIEMVWKHRGVTKTRVELDVGVSAGWRTWSKRNISRDDVGAWTLEVRDTQGTLLESMEFTVKHGQTGRLRKL